MKIERLVVFGQDIDVFKVFGYKFISTNNLNFVYHYYNLHAIAVNTFDCVVPIWSVARDNSRIIMEYGIMHVF